MPSATKKKTSRRQSRRSRVSPGDYQLVIYWDPEDQIFIAEAPELQGCRTHGGTYEEAAKNGREAMELWLEDELARGHVLPRPQTRGSGTLSLRLPASLHGKVARRAAREGVSINQWIVAKLAEEEGRSARRR
jgi:predicted RNase H-like HicB family nuclease